MKGEVRRLDWFDPIPLSCASPWANPLPDVSFRAVIQSKPIRANVRRPPSIKRETAVLPASLLPPHLPCNLTLHNQKPHKSPA